MKHTTQNKFRAFLPEIGSIGYNSFHTGLPVKQNPKYSRETADKYLKILLGLSLIILLNYFAIHYAQAADSQGMTLKHNEQEYLIPEQTLAEWQDSVTVFDQSLFFRQKLDLRDALKQAAGLEPISAAKTKTLYTHNPRLVYSYIQNLALNEFNRKPVEPELVIVNGRAEKFTAPADGSILNVLATTKEILQSLAKSLNTADLIAITSKPTKNLSETNDLGINELIARGESTFSGSPKNRRHNIEIGTNKIKGVIIPEGGIFSFNQNLGPVEASEGFLPELVIKKDGTQPELGGGLCQVSSTTFRAAMKAGLPITQRRNHSYAVQYYSPQGTDATIYPGVIDLKFINDTPGSILVWPYFKDKDHLVFDFYGSKDSRQVTLYQPVIYDKKSDGSMKATWTREVTKNGETKKDIFNSTYQSPALFHKTEQFIPSTSPTTNLTSPVIN